MRVYRKTSVENYQSSGWCDDPSYGTLVRMVEINRLAMMLSPEISLQWRDDGWRWGFRVGYSWAFVF
ncbi:hypothetical protein L1987_12703 [Smallanthus sonchifolius]|uniref:Uncharacterized protein n=1 Tax=Smallanthus sonchifolius TaxID=185202 RepID=A0ACB9JFG8_9ASTR|nr:hypothetical protein L1987_12703 [Smallanthus sonchifolius]